MNSKTSDIVERLTKCADVSFDAYVPWNRLVTVLQPRKRSTKEHSLISIYANVYGPHFKADDVGSCLSKDDVFLQEPFWRPSEVTYSNPQVIEFDDIDEENVLLQDMLEASDHKASIMPTVDWSSVLDQLPQYHTFSSTVDGISLSDVLKR